MKQDTLFLIQLSNFRIDIEQMTSGHSLALPSISTCSLLNSSFMNTYMQMTTFLCVDSQCSCRGICLPFLRLQLGVLLHSILFIRSIICITTLLSTCDFFHQHATIPFTAFLDGFISHTSVVRVDGESPAFALGSKVFQEDLCSGSVPYNSFLSQKYMTLLPFSFCRFLRCIYESSLAINSSNLPSIFMCILPTKSS